MKLFLNISSDKVQLSLAGEALFLERNGIENVLGPTLVDLYQKSGFSEVLVLNGPGGFTNLRVGTLAVNLLNALLEYKLGLFSLSKIELFSQMYRKGALPSCGIVYIGQRRNVWLWDFEKGELLETLPLDQVEENVKGMDFFLDEVFDDAYYSELSESLRENMATICFGEDISLIFHGKTFSVDMNEFSLPRLNQIEANYCIDPIITPAKTK